MTRLAAIAKDIYRDQARSFGFALVRDSPHLAAIVDNVTPEPFDPWPDPAAPVVAARLLHDLVTIRRHLPLNSGSAWTLAETYLLMNDFEITGANDEIASLIGLLREGRLDEAATLHLLAATSEPSEVVQWLSQRLP